MGEHAVWRRENCIRTCGLAVLVAFSGFHISQMAIADVSGDASPVAPQRVTLFEQTLDAGLLFIDGEFAAGPYVIEATAEQLIVNGNVCMEVTGEPEPVSDGQRQRRRTADDDDASHDGDDGRRSRVPARVAEQFAETLENDGIVVLFRGSFPTCISSGGAVSDFCAALLSENPTDSEKSDFVKLPNDDSQTELWRSWLADFQPTSELRTRLQSKRDFVISVEADGLSRTAALQRLETLTYPLTLAGMFLGVFSLGHIVKWTARVVASEKDESCVGELSRCAAVGLLLMLGMAAIDLVWTILAGEAGVMREVNPLAASLIHSSVQLVVFKFVATGLGIGILFVLRHRRQIQNATWWMCLVCILLTFRWVVFDSVMS